MLYGIREMGVVNRLKSKIKAWRWSHLKTLWMRYGIPFLIIFIAWEIVEDVVFPAIFYLLGTHVNEAFYLGIPAAWILCFHPVAVPILWAIYCYATRKKHVKIDLEEDDCC